MKRILAVCVCVFLCCSLAACGGGKYDRLTAMLDEGDYTGAVGYINQLAYEAAEQEKGDKDPTASAHLPYLCGTWEERNVPTNETPSASLVFKEDRTCTVGERSYLWEVSDEGDTHLGVEVLDGATKVYTVTMGKNDKGHYSLSAYAVKENGSSESLGTYINYDHYEAVTLTKDNWDTYFTLEETPHYSTDSFDEVSELALYKRYVLKDDYYARLMTSVTKVAVELSYVRGNYEAVYDLSAKTYTLKNYKPETDSATGKVERFTSKYSFHESTRSSGEWYYGYGVGSSSAYTRDDGTQYFSWYSDDFRIERVQGTLYLLKDKK